MAMSDTQSTRYYVPAVGGIYASLDRYMLPLLRAGLGVILIAHGSQKLFGLFGGMGYAGNAALFEKLGYAPGAFWGTLVGCTEFFGGILLVIGLFVRPAAAAVVIFMLFSIQFTAKNGFFWTKGGMEYSILILLVAALFAVRGSGPCALDNKMAKEF
jgi:putative oxidoreductase